eukprot:SAG31_NODE_27515_length_425_cov_0.496933_1_plen_85_part_10
MGVIGNCELKGKLNCPCGAKLGSYNWSGAQCSCGAWVSPAFQINTVRVDEVTVFAAATLDAKTPQSAPASQMPSPQEEIHLPQPQ